MKQYSHDYTLPSLAESLMQTADAAIRLEDYDKASRAINDARQTLQQYLSQDNMVEDDDVENGWVSYNDAARELEDARKLNAHYRETMLAMGKTGMAAASLAEENIAELEELRSRQKPSGPKIERHEKLKPRLKIEGVGDPACPLYDKHVRISGTFDQIGKSRDGILDAIQQLGAKYVCTDIIKGMDVVVFGNNYGPAKEKKVKQWQSEGRKIRIISQFELKDIFDKYLKAE